MSSSVTNALIDYPGAITAVDDAVMETREGTMPDVEYWRLMGRLGAFTMHSKYNAKELTKPARAAAWKRYLDMVDPERKLTPEDRDARATAARHAQMIRMSQKSQAARRAKKGLSPLR